MKVVIKWNNRRRKKMDKGNGEFKEKEILSEVVVKKEAFMEA